jgi:hypothetical protein
MTALAQDVARIQEGVEFRRLGLGATKVVYQGGMVAADGATGHSEAAADTALMKFQGVAEEGGVGSATAGAVKIEVARRGIFKFLAGSTFAAIHIGVPVCVGDDQTVKLPWETTNRVYCGKLVAYDASGAWVEIDDAVAGKISDVRASGVIEKTAVSADHVAVLYKCPKGRKARVCNLKTFIETIPNYDTTVLVLSNRDASAGADDNLLSTANVDLEDDVAKAVTALTLSATVADLLLDEDDVIFGVVTTGANAVTAGEGIAVFAELVEW